MHRPKRVQTEFTRQADTYAARVQAEGEGSVLESSFQDSSRDPAAVTNFG